MAGDEERPSLNPFDALPDALLGHIQVLAGIRAEVAIVSQRWWRCWLAEPTVWEEQSLYCRANTPEELEQQLERAVEKAQQVGRHASQLELDVWSPKLQSSKIAGTVTRRLPQLLACLTPGRLQLLQLRNASLTDGVAAALQRLAPGLEWLQFGSTACALPAAQFSQLAGHFSALESLDVGASYVAPSVLEAVAALPQLDELQLESQAALPDARQLSALTRLSRLELWQSKHAVGPLLPPSAAPLTRLTRLAFSAADMQLPSGERCTFRENLSGGDEWYHLAFERTDSGSLQLTVQYANMDDEEEGGGAPLAALYRTMLPAGAAVQELWLEECAIASSAGGSSFSECGPLLAGMTKLGASMCFERTARSDAALRRALDACIALTPNLHRLDMGNYGAFYEPGWTLTAGPPPAVLGLGRLESLSLEGMLLPALPEGPYVAGLTYLNLNGCRLSGPVPPVLQAATRLQQLCLAGNAGLKLDESSVAMLSSLPALSQLGLSRGQLQEAAAQLSALAPPAGKVQIIPSFMY